MVMSLSSFAEPLGSIKPWLRPDASTPLPGGWLICDGSIVVDASSPYNGKALPDLRSRFPRGHSALDNANFGADATYFAGGTVPLGGAASHNLNHNHSGGNHSHGINSDGNHSHPITSDGSHSHTANVGDAGKHVSSNPLQTHGSASNYVINLTGPGNTCSHNFPVHVQPGGSHNHGGSTSLVGKHNHGGSTQISSGSTGFNLGTIDNNPPHADLVLIIKVK